MDEQVVRLSRVLYADLDTPVSLGIHLRQKYGEWDQFLAMRIDPRNYIDTSLGADKYLRDVQALDLLRKFPNLPVEVDKRKVAVDSFWAAEKQCKRTNMRLYPFVANYGLTASDERIWKFIRKAQRMVKKILGPLPGTLVPRFGPGAIYESQGHRFSANFTVADKMSMRFAATPLCRHLAEHFIWPTLWGRAIVESQTDHRILEVPGNRFTTVVKDATKDRGICIEPGANVALQLAVGRWLKARLKRYHLDLSQGQELHRRLAAWGSLSGELATMDLSNASDTVSYQLVKLLLPEEWFDLLNDLRSPKTKIDGQWVVLEKFSSMGNGFTFELETLIFSVITAVACGGHLGYDVFCYGDDIIYPSEHARDVEAALRYFGFTPNAKKSFAVGPFRESCGGDFFGGFPVRPFQLDKDPADDSEWITVANGLLRASGQVGGVRYKRAWLRALFALRPSVRACGGPTVLGDLVVHGVKWMTKERPNGIRYLRVYRPVLKRVRLDRFSPGVQLATAVYGVADGGRSNTIEILLRMESGKQPGSYHADPAYLIPRNGVSGHRFGRVAYS